MFYKFYIKQKFISKLYHCASSHDSVAHYSVGDGNVEIVSSEKIKVLSMYYIVFFIL